MDYTKIRVDIDADVLTITLDDPSTLNACTYAMIEQIDDALDRHLPNARALLMTGVGRSFSSGANLGEEIVKDDDGRIDAGSSLETHVNPLMQRLRALPVPWVNAVPGAAAGVGCSLALAADLIVASDQAYFLQAFSRIGLVPDGGSTWLVSRACGRARAMEMMMLGERISAAQALEWGLINRVVAADDLQDTARALALRLATGPTQALAMIRSAVWHAADSGWADVLANERVLQRQAGITGDFAEGVAAFMEKRPARFAGC